MRIKYVKKCFLGILMFSAIITTLGAGGNDNSETEMVLKNAGVNINTAGADFFPSITADGTTMVFSVKPVDSETSDIFISYFKDDVWQPATPISAINTQYDDQTPYISSDGKILIFSSNRKGTIRPPRENQNIYYLTNDLYISFNENGEWSSPQWLKGEVNTADNERAPSLSKDGKTLYFSRYKGNDIHSSKIYSAALEGISTSNVTLMLRPINSDYSDFGLMPSNSKPGFYFSSSRPGGMGLWDIYFVSYMNNEFGEPINLGAPINSEYNDLSITELGNKIFFCSDRKGGIGDADVYTITISTRVFKLPDTGFVFSVVDKKSKSPISTSLEISVYPMDQKAGDEIKNFIIESNQNGECELKTDYYAKRITVRPRDGRFKADELNLDASAGEMRKVTIELQEAEKSTEPVVAVQKEETSPPTKSERTPKVWNIQPIYFEYKSSELTNKNMQRIWNITKLLESEKNICMKITGHTDPKGSDAYNIKLGYARALSVKNALVKNGLKVQYQLISKGESQPSELYKNTGQQKYNRRVEIRVKECADVNSK